jgi:hypothetical protein
MCGVCGLLDSGPQWSDPLQLQQMAMLNHALAPFRLKLTDFHTSWVLASPTGQQVIVNSLEQIWQEAEALLKRPLDPLDDDWLDALEQTR